jgi:hypothetical protein
MIRLLASGDPQSVRVVLTIGLVRTRPGIIPDSVLCVGPNMLAWIVMCVGSKYGLQTGHWLYSGHKGRERNIARYNHVRCSPALI